MLKCLDYENRQNLGSHRVATDDNTIGKQGWKREGVKVYIIDYQCFWFLMVSWKESENIGPGYGFKCKSLGNRKRMPRDFFII